MRRAALLVLSLSFVASPSSDALGAGRIRLAEVAELSPIIIRGEILETDHLRAGTAKRLTEQRVLIRVKETLRGEHRINQMLEQGNTLWLHRQLTKAPGSRFARRRSYRTAFKPQAGAEGLFFLRFERMTTDPSNHRRYAQFEWMDGTSVLRKLGPVLRKVRKAEGLRIRAGGRCRFATFAYGGKCRNATQLFAMLRCPQGTTLHDSRYREYGLKLACKSLRKSLPHGPTTLWNEGGDLESMTTMFKGRRHGMRLTYGAGGRKLSAAEYVHGKRSGRVVTWHPNGQIDAEGRILEGLEDGEFRQYSREGKLLGSYVMKRGTGTVRVWREDGSLQVESHRVNGRSHGIRTQWYPGGALMSRGPMKHGKMNARWTFHAPAGETQHTVCYQATDAGSPRETWRVPGDEVKRPCPVDSEVAGTGDE